MRISLQPTHQSTAYASIYGTGISLEHTHQSAAYAVIFGSAGGNTRPEGCDWLFLPYLVRMADNIRGPSHGYNLYNDLVRAFEKRTISSNLRWPVLNEYGWECHGRYLYQLRADKIKRNRFKDFSLAATLLRDEPLKQLWPPKPVEMPERVSNLTAIQKNKDRQRKLNYNIPNIIKKKVWQTSKPVEMRAERLRSKRTGDIISTSTTIVYFAPTKTGSAIIRIEMSGHQLAGVSRQWKFRNFTWLHFEISHWNFVSSISVFSC